MKRPLRLFRRAVVIVAVLTAILYVGEDLSLRFRIPKSRNPFGVVTIHQYYAVTLKNQKTEIYPLPATQQVCVHSLFPHLGYNPCWYVNRNKEQRINL